MKISTSALIVAIATVTLAFPANATKNQDYLNGLVDGAYYTSLLQIAKHLSLIGNDNNTAIRDAAKCAGSKTDVVEFVVKNFGKSLDDEVKIAVAISETMFARCEKRMSEAA